MAAAVRALIASHVAMFVAGFAAGKYVDHDELKTYRDLHESSWTRFERRLSRGVLGVAAVGSLYLVVRLSMASSSSKELPQPV
jgi:hypothetical protein